MKKIAVFIMALTGFLGLVANAGAISYSGSISTGSMPVTLFGRGLWGEGASLQWTVDNETNPGFWNYSYTFSVLSELEVYIQNIIFEVSGNFTAADVISASTTEGWTLGLNSVEVQGVNNTPSMVGVYGIKWDAPAGVQTLTSLSATLVSPREPMWGDFYSLSFAVEGFGNQYAYNINFGGDSADPIGSGNAGGWVLVPNLTVIPGPIPQPVAEPSTSMLLATGLASLGLLGRRRRKNGRG